jgi:HEAT repeat protein
MKGKQAILMAAMLLATGGLSSLVGQTPAALGDRNDVARRVAQAISDRDSEALRRFSAELSVATPENLGVLDRLMQSETPKAREFAASTLAGTGTGDSVAHLLAAIRQEPDSRVHDNMLESLHGVRNPAAVPELARCAQLTSDEVLHRECTLRDGLSRGRI